jgi:uncharacterized protein
VIDADQHFDEVPETWDSIDPAFRDAALTVQSGRGGRRWLACRGRAVMPLRHTYPGEIDTARELVREDSRGYERWRAERRSAPVVHDERAASDAVTRTAVLDASGIAAALLFPSYGLFWPSVVTDGEVADANFAAYNTWIAGACSPAPHRLLGVAQYSIEDVDRAVREVWRAHELGLNGFFLRAVPYRGRPWSDMSNEPVWAALEQAGLPLMLHSAPLGALGHDADWEKGLPPEHLGQPPLTFLNRSLPAEAALASLVLGGVLDRHPGLRVAVVEFGAVWVPSFLHRLDAALDFLGPRNRYLRERLQDRPSGYVRRQVRFTAFWSEPIAWLGAVSDPGLYMFSSDFPHPEGSEDALARVRASLDGQPDDVVGQFLGDAARYCLGGRLGATRGLRR